MKEKRIRIVMLCCALAVALSLSLLAAPLVTATENAELLSGTIHDIYTAADLLEMANSSDTFYLRNDLDLTNFGNWTPIEFSGTFDGMGHAIKGVSISGYEGDYVGFFSMLSGTVKNLHINVNIQERLKETDDYSSYMEVGGLAGRLSGYGTVCGVYGVSVSGQMRMTVSRLHGVTMGGLVGFAEGGGIISDCSSSVNVTLTLEGTTVAYGSYCGGLIGNAESPIINSYATGNVMLVGMSLSEGYHKGIYCDGLVGECNDVRHSYYCNLKNPQLGGNGTYLTAEAMKQQSTYVDWDFSTVWDISPTVNDGFPFLRQPEALPPSSVALDRGSLTLGVGKSQLLQATVLPAEATARHLDWFSSDASIVDLTPVTDPSCGEINARMMVNAKAPGVAVVTAVTTEGKIEAACTVTVSDGKSEPLPVYRLNGIAAQDSDGNALTAVPSGSFLATVSMTNIASADSPTIVLAAYTAEKKYVGLFYVTLKSPVGGTIEAAIPVDNSAGNIAELKAFAVSSFSDLSIIGNPVSFPAK